MLGIWKLRLFEWKVEPVPAECVDRDDGPALSKEEVERIARSLIEKAPLDDRQRRDYVADAAQPGDG